MSGRRSSRVAQAEKSINEKRPSIGSKSTAASGSRKRRSGEMNKSNEAFADEMEVDINGDDNSTLADDQNNEENQVNASSDKPPVNLKDEGVKLCNQLTEREKRDWITLDEDTQQKLVKIATRVFLFKGSRNESIAKAKDISSAIEKVNVQYKKYTNAAIAESQKVLDNSFGFGLISEDVLLGASGSNLKTKYMLFSNISSTHLSEVLANQRTQEENAYKGFVWAVTQALFCSPGKRMTAEELLKELRKLDSRFPASISEKDSKNKSTAAYAVPELGNDFLGLLRRMTIESYLSIEKDTSSVPGEDSISYYSIGNRTLVEIGRTKLVESHFSVLGEDPDEGILAETKDMEDNLRKKKQDDLEDKRVKKVASSSKGKAKVKGITSAIEED